ncbi:MULTISPECIES: (4S)-4-hydroxy-5-phosphonooxypentane-2,3-dione isomerase [Pseudovibrio]|uniref:(4S)-4-hydroxy-5-phosphonooxypentane-2,3-dione isomerase n=1 Tax=Stappiaceae TaxID=2821832 RepID=UPI002365A9AA|nr:MULTISPECIES: (4S)-4-hydroxy-5-phosphonooxypentane-2,3-dione isomerase [Pseudovibrio]MDD7908834.1 (4S)-4-hydroxy-5-phosphonooxypentane-2,3-dione isomerase [Pseudovibrio exalbescens]MDX5593849.1 (4S)-4-hydroxy-5-phosphonooxypentane-2,3-dione isomerase [Pseudovibrio sp. SPO723]
MHVTLVEIQVKPDRIEDFLRVFRPNHEGSIQEPGCLRFDVLQDPEDPTKFSIYEAYVDQDAVLAHKQTPHYLKVKAELEDIMTGPRTHRVFKGILPEV